MCCIRLNFFNLAGAPEIGVSDDWYDAAILQHECDSYRTNVLPVEEIFFVSDGTCYHTDTQATLLGAKC